MEDQLKFSAFIYLEIQPLQGCTLTFIIFRPDTSGRLFKLNPFRVFIT